MAAARNGGSGIGRGWTGVDNAEVVAVRQGQPIREYVWDAQGDDKVLETTGNVYFVDVK